MAIRSSGGAALLLLSFMALLSALVVPATAQGFKCSSNSSAKCNALIDYVFPNKTTLARISSLFNVTNFYDLLGANSLPLSTQSSQIFEANKTIKIPFPCSCSNGTGISDKIPVYTVVKDDGLYHIAHDVFSALVTFQQIADVNKIPDPNKIDVGQELWIPLPCSCDKVAGDEVVHYGHVVVNGSSVKQIADEYGTNESTLLSLNGMSDPNALLAGQVLDVPLKVCTSSIKADSEDYPLLVPNGTYSLTAYNCIQCSCNSNNWTLHCKPSQGVKPTNLTQCPSMQCNDSLLIGNAETTSSCAFCDYAGFNNLSIAAVVNNSTCSLGNYAPGRICLAGSSWRVLLVTIHVGLLCFGLLW